MTRAPTWAELPARVRNRLIAAMRETVKIDAFDLANGAGDDSYATELRETIAAYGAAIKELRRAGKRRGKR